MKTNSAVHACVAAFIAATLSAAAIPAANAQSSGAEQVHGYALASRSAGHAALQLSAWRTKGNSVKVRIESNAPRVRLRITPNRGRSQTSTLRLAGIKTVRVSPAAVRVRARTLATGRLASSGWKAVAVPRKRSTTAGTQDPSRDKPPAGTDPGAFELEVFQLTNNARKSARMCGSTSYPAAAALSYDNRLGLAARRHSADMAARGYFSHTTPEGLSPWDRMAAAGYTSYSAAAENIAGGQSSPAEVVSGWLTSPGHCSNIMSGSLTQLGVGYATGGPYRTYWTQDFARPR